MTPAFLALALRARGISVQTCSRQNSSRSSPRRRWACVCAHSRCNGCKKIDFLWPRQNDFAQQHREQQHAGRVTCVLGGARAHTRCPPPRPREKPVHESAFQLQRRDGEGRVSRVDCNCAAWQFDAVSKILERILAVKKRLEVSVPGLSNEDHQSMLVVVGALEDIADDMEMVGSAGLV